ncbi:hypothetical protein H0H81_000647 [Sphagnurus paluster]|uniref:Pyridine nucleotide-disulphide oxidoreductase N-terminal domain-containing protein n=1 Tax=Sphagnurus paluster TaxID=117069 RepID=A0A9P7G2A4_9AGAR|nr:hypothetical protein H0H81_000647 [Sphagnurus paluster]
MASSGSPPPSKAAETGGRLTGEDMCVYMENFACTFLEGKIRFSTLVKGIRRAPSGGWLVTVKDLLGRHEAQVLDNPKIPEHLSPTTAEKARFRGLVFHSTYFQERLDGVLERTKTGGQDATEQDASVVVVGGGKSAQDVAAYLANAGRKVTVVFETTDAMLAGPSPLPDELHASLAPNHQSSSLTHSAWVQLDTYSIPKDSPLRNAHSLFWGIRTNDEGLAAPARAQGFSDDGRSLILNAGQTLPADVVVLATGYQSSWKGIFDDETVADLGLARHAPPSSSKTVDEWDYMSLSDPPPCQLESDHWSSSIYRGLVPAKNLDKRGFAVNGAVFTTNNGYGYEVSAHWISAYFLGGKMRLPSSAEEALVHTERNSAWMHKRYPGMLTWVNESYSSNLAFWSYVATCLCSGINEHSRVCF